MKEKNLWFYSLSFRAIRPIRSKPISGFCDRDVLLTGGTHRSQVRTPVCRWKLHSKTGRQSVWLWIWGSRVRFPASVLRVLSLKRTINLNFLTLPRCVIYRLSTKQKPFRESRYLHRSISRWHLSSQPWETVAPPNFICLAVCQSAVSLSVCVSRFYGLFLGYNGSNFDETWWKCWTWYSIDFSQAWLAEG